MIRGAQTWMFALKSYKIKERTRNHLLRSPTSSLRIRWKRKHVPVEKLAATWAKTIILLHFTAAGWSGYRRAILHKKLTAPSDLSAQASSFRRLMKGRCTAEHLSPAALHRTPCRPTQAASSPAGTNSRPLSEIVTLSPSGGTIRDNACTSTRLITS